MRCCCTVQCDRLPNGFDGSVPTCTFNRLNNCLNNQLHTMIRVHSHLRFITRLRLRFLSIGWIGIAITITKMGAQPILKPNGYCNLNRVINQRYEWTTKGCSHSVTASAIFYHNKRKIKCKCSRGAIATVTLNSIQPINCDKQIAVTIAPCECAFRVYFCTCD